MGFRNSCLIPFLLFLYLFSLNTQLSYGADTLPANQSLSGDQTLVSSGENFELGFFKPGKSSKYYIGIWYKKVTTPTIVWVANRERPVSDRFSSELRMVDGNLVLYNESKVPIWSSNVNSTTSSSSVVAVLRDDGNLVLRDGPNTSLPLWQSFDYPADTWLPGGKLAYNNRTGTKQLLTSWKNAEDPAPGLYSLELDPNKKQYFIKLNGSEPYWTSGSWNGRIFSFVPEMIRPNWIFDYSYNITENESYFTYSINDPSILSRFVMDVSGQVKQLTWLPVTKEWNLFWTQPRQQCDVNEHCGAFSTCNDEFLPFCRCLAGFRPRSDSDWQLSDFSGGCVREINLQCGNTSGVGVDKQGFLTMSQVGLPQDSQSLAVGSLGTAAKCRSSCLNSCYCTAYAYNNSGCSIWNRDLLNLKQLTSDDVNGRVIHIKLAKVDIPSSKDNKGLIRGAVGGSLVGVVLLAIILFAVWRRRRRFLVNMKTVEGSLVAFGYRDLQNVTKNFSEKLGGGGFGSVFKGILPDSTIVAVKKLESISQGEKQFRTEVSTIGTIQHVNLVRLRGFCSDGNKKLLVYEYMPNGSLDSHFFREKSDKALDWKTRYQIALGTARGLFYLHEKCRDCIIHCDIKPENILLDAELCPKVADFGLAKLVGRDFSRVLTTMRGTRGYLAPEWISGIAVTAKADVYSYGMMLFEIVSGRRNAEQSEDGRVKIFPQWAASVTIDGGDILGLLDHRLDRSADVEEVTRMCRVACWCIQGDEENRPSMSQVVQILEGLSDVNVPPVPRSVQVFGDNSEHIVFFTESSSSQSSHVHRNPSITSSQSKSTISSTSSRS